MLLTVSKRLEFSASRRLFVSRWTESENLIAFGPETAAKHGTGRNYVVWFICSGPVNPENGMLINISEMKERANSIVQAQFDHKFLNADNSAFAELPPTAENLARELFLHVAPTFAGGDATLVACHLRESPARSATYYASGACEGHYWFGLSAARRTVSPRLSEKENGEVFGQCASIHGHEYRGRLTFQTEKWDGGESPLVRYDRISTCLHSLHAELDHRYLNEDVAGLNDRPMTTESIAEYIYERVNAVMPLHRVRLHERADFFAEYWNDESVFLGLQVPFAAAHRLHAPSLSDAANVKLYGKCNNANGHGHRYVAEATLGGKYDERTGTLADFTASREALEEAVEPWNNRHLDRETEDFRDQPSTGENIVRTLWPRVDNSLQQQLVRLRLWETENNRFTLRRI